MVHVSLRSYVVSFSFLLLNGVLVSKVMGRGILVFVFGFIKVGKECFHTHVSATT